MYLQSCTSNIAARAGNLGFNCSDDKQIAWNSCGEQATFPTILDASEAATGGVRRL
jgi:hypothetical protein